MLHLMRACGALCTLLYCRPAAHAMARSQGTASLQALLASQPASLQASQGLQAGQGPCHATAGPPRPQLRRLAFMRAPRSASWHTTATRCCRRCCPPRRLTRVRWVGEALGLVVLHIELWSWAPGLCCLAPSMCGKPLRGLRPPTSARSNPPQPRPADGVVIYSKGAALLRMLEDFLDRQRPGAFQAGVRVRPAPGMAGLFMPPILEVACWHGLHYRIKHAAPSYLCAHVQQDTGFSAPVCTKGREIRPLALLPLLTVCCCARCAAPPLQAFLQRHKGSTATMADLLSALVDQAAPISQPPNSKPLATFAQLARQYATSCAELAGAPPGDAGSGSNALSANPLSAWLHAPSYPYLPLGEVPAAAPGSSNGNNSTNSSAWVQLAAAQQRPFCAWQPEPAGNTSASQGAPGGAAGECPAAGTQWWLPLDAAAAFSLPACDTAAGNSSSSGGSSSGIQEPVWVLNLVGAGLYRVAYPEEHMQRLLGALSQLEPCYRASNASASGWSTQLAAATAANDATSLTVGSGSCGSLNASSCELEAAPLLAASAALSDAAALAQTGQVSAAVVFQAAQAAARAPAASTGKRCRHPDKGSCLLGWAPHYSSKQAISHGLPGHFTWNVCLCCTSLPCKQDITQHSPSPVAALQVLGPFCCCFRQLRRSPASGPSRLATPAVNSS